MHVRFIRCIMQPQWGKISLLRSLSGCYRTPWPHVKSSRTPAASPASSWLLLRNFVAFNHFEAFPLHSHCNLKRKGPIQKEQVLNGLC